MARHLGASQVNSPHSCRGVPRGSIRGSGEGQMEHMHNSGAISGAVSQSAACSKRKFSLHSGSARTKMAAHLTHVFARTPPCRPPSTPDSQKKMSKLQLEKRERECMYARLFFVFQPFQQKTRTVKRRKVQQQPLNHFYLTARKFFI